MRATNGTAVVDTVCDVYLSLHIYSLSVPCRCEVQVFTIQACPPNLGQRGMAIVVRLDDDWGRLVQLSQAEYSNSGTSI